MPETTAVHAAWLLVGKDMQALQNATVIISEGTIADITSRHVPTAIDLGDVALLPGLVNAHTHLELSDLRRPLSTPLPFTGWIQALIQHRRSRCVTSSEAMLQGLRECQAAGVVAVGDILSSQVLSDHRLPDEVIASNAAVQAVYFHEVIGFSRSALDAALRRNELVVSEDRDRRCLPETYQIGVSPHAPYSVHPQLVAELARHASQYSVPLAMHLAETRAELEFLNSQTGEFRQMLERFGVWEEGVISPGTRLLNYLELLEDVGRVLIVHGNYVGDEDLVHLSEHQCPDRSLMSVVYCPRTHAYFQHDEHRFREMLALGINVCLGTDSRASNPDLSVWEEVKFLRRRYPELSASDLIGMATWRGALALGLEGKLGTIEVGKSARLAVVELAGAATDPFEERLFSGQSRDSRIEIR